MPLVGHASRLMFDVYVYRRDLEEEAVNFKEDLSLCSAITCWEFCGVWMSADGNLIIL
jgi:hypothetical protein